MCVYIYGDIVYSLIYGIHGLCGYTLYMHTVVVLAVVVAVAVVTAVVVWVKISCTLYVPNTIRHKKYGVRRI